jgi:hypothetical protein
MARWTKVKWTEAAQIAEQLNWPDDARSGAGVPPSTYFARLRAQGRVRDAAQFLGQALGRFEAVVWATRVVRENQDGDEPQEEALKAAIQWTRNPSEAHRRAAYDAAGHARRESPSRLAALAAFFSGGSMSPDGQPPVPAPRDAAGRLAAGAVLMAAIQSKDRRASLDLALDQGDALASGTLEAKVP